MPTPGGKSRGEMEGTKMAKSEMTLYQLWWVSPLCFVFVRGKDGKLREYRGERAEGQAIVDSVLATKYPI